MKNNSLVKQANTLVRLCSI